MATKVKSQRIEAGAVVENLGFNPDKRPLTGEGEPTTVTPEYVGQQYIDTTTNKMYFATGTEEGNWEEVGSGGGGGGDFDPDGYYPALHAGLTDQIYTDENTVSIGAWNFRTSAGDVSIPNDGIASITSIKGNYEVIDPGTPAVANFNPSAGIYVTSYNIYGVVRLTNNDIASTIVCTLTGGVWDDDPAAYGINVSLQQQEFDIESGTFSDSTGDVFKAYVTTSRGTFRMWYDTDNSVWTLSNGTDTRTDADTTTFGITTPGSTSTVVYVNYYDECTDGTLEVSLTTALVPPTLEYPAKFKIRATGVNQYDWSNTYQDSFSGFEWNYTLNFNTRQVEYMSGSSCICVVPYFPGVTNGYHIYNWVGTINRIGFIPLTRATDFNQLLISGSIANYISGKSFTPIDEPNDSSANFHHNYDFGNNYGFILIEKDADTTGLSVHPAWSGQQDNNTDAFTYSDSANAGPYFTYMKVGDVYDEYDGSAHKYSKRIESSWFSYQSLYELSTDHGEIVFDNDHIFYKLGYDSVFDADYGTYTANDYGTERLIDANNNYLTGVPSKIVTSYGTNLVDKLRTGVALASQIPQVMFQEEYNNVQNPMDGTIRFIYTCDKPDSLNVMTVSLGDWAIGSTYTFAQLVENVWIEITPNGYPFDLSTMTVTSSDPSVISVSGDTITWEGVGSTTISVSFMGLTASNTWEIVQ